MLKRRTVLKKLILDLQYQPTVRIYRAMDEVGFEFRNEFPDWRRHALALELFDKRNHRRFSMTFNRSQFDSDSPDDVNTELPLAINLAKTLCEKLDVQTFRRCSLRFMFVAKVKQHFEALVELLEPKFLVPSEHIGGVSRMTLVDMAYVANFRHEEWRYDMRLGPMEKEQYFQIVHHEPQAFEAEDAEGTLRNYRTAFPERFVFVDIDVNSLDVNPQSVWNQAHHLWERARQTAKDLVNYCGV